VDATSGLSEHTWTIKELIEKAAELLRICHGVGIFLIPDTNYFRKSVTPRNWSDSKMDDQLLEKLVRLQEEQNELLRKNLWRVKFSLFALMLLMTLSAVGLGTGVYLTRPKATPVIPLVTAPANPRTSSGMGPGMGMGPSRGRMMNSDSTVPSTPADDPFR
jgi:hypothetical protein